MTYSTSPQHRVVRCQVNGEAVQAEADVRFTLADFLRKTLGLTGTHLGCEHGVCGACTVLVDGRAVRSCLMLAVQAEDADVCTVESLGDENTLSILQSAFRDHHALQCGYCTPGILMTLMEVFSEGSSHSEEDLRVALSGNLCRCTGYNNIIAAALSAGRILAEQKGGRT